jgi:hypothetical protein
MVRKIRKDATIKTLVDKYGVPPPVDKNGRKIRSDATINTVNKKLKKK